MSRNDHWQNIIRQHYKTTSKRTASMSFYLMPPKKITLVEQYFSRMTLIRMPLPELSSPSGLTFIRMTLSYFANWHSGASHSMLQVNLLFVNQNDTHQNDIQPNCHGQNSIPLWHLKCKKLYRSILLNVILMNIFLLHVNLHVLKLSEVGTSRYVHLYNWFAD